MQTDLFATVQKKTTNAVRKYDNGTYVNRQFYTGKWQMNHTLLSIPILKYGLSYITAPWL
jgi:hypothetical protein